MSALTDLEQQLRESQDDLQSCQEALAEDPEDATVLELIEALVTQIAQLKRDIAAATSSASPPPPLQHHQQSKPTIDDPTPPPPPPPNAGPDEPPPPPSESAAISFNVGDVVLAKFSQDKQYYQAKIISKTGSSADPVYYVHFIGYPDKENKRNHEVRPVEHNKKRKNDGTPAAATPTARVPSVPIQNGAVISAAPSLEPPQPARHVPSLVSDGPTRMAPEPKKLKPNKKLEKAASSWQNFRKTGPKNPISGLSKQQLNRDSMFRTSDLPSAKGELPYLLLRESNYTSTHADSISL
jgi:survival-of-motor-neuron-related-splicing factor 30